MFEPTVITIDEVVPTAKRMLHDGWRFITHTVVDLGEEGFDILFHYDRELKKQDFRLSVPRGTVIPSMSGVYFAAMLVENENRDLFGLEYGGLVLDFNRTLYLDEAGDPITAPFCKISTFTKPVREV
jgi:ech hydrogenase subunit D